MKHFLCILLSLSMIHCDGKESDTPEYDPNTLLTISGRFLDGDGTPLTSTPIHMKNLRYDSYIDPVKCVVDQIDNLIFSLIYLAWVFPFYLFGSSTDASAKPDPGVVRPNYFNDKIKTDSEGNFEFSIKAGKFLRDENGGVNIELVNNKASDDSLFGKYQFVIKEEDSVLGDLQLCSLGGLEFTENDDDVTISWEAAPSEVTKYITNFGISSSNALLWSVETDSETTSITVPKTVFNDFEIKVASQAYYTFEDQKKISCLSEPLTFTLTSPTSSIITDTIAEVSNVKFKVTSFSNGKLNDPVFLKAFNSKQIIIDMEEALEFSNINFHNLSLVKAGETTISTSDDKTTWTELGTEAEVRFMTYALDTSVTARYLKFDFSSQLVDLKEITVN
jgi:hypothetical protein